MRTKTVLGIVGAPAKSHACKLLDRALIAVAEGNPKVEVRRHILRDNFKRGSVQKLIENADGYIIATPVHWFNVSVLTKRLIDEVFDCFADRPWKLTGKPFGVIATCNEDGANQAIASVVMPLNHCGLCLPPFATLIHNFKIEHKGRFRWQDEPEEIGKQISKYLA